MIDPEPAEPLRQVMHFALLILVGFMVVGSVLLSGRAPTLASFNNVAPAGELPSGITPAYLDDWGVTIHRSDWNAPVAVGLGRTGVGRKPYLGWIVREWSFLALPLFAYRQSDVAVVSEDTYGFRLSALTPEERRLVERHGAIGVFWFWRYSWGLLAVAALGAWVWLEFRWQARRRAILGLI